MKKTFYILALAAIALSCTKEMETSNPAVSGEKVTVKVALAEDDATKVSLSEAADKKSMSLAWEATDKISINTETFSIKAGFTAHEAEFEGNAPSGSSYTIIYPGKYTDIAAFNARSYASQTQDGNSSTAHLEYNAALEGVSEYLEPKFDPSWAADKGGTLKQNGVVQLRLQLPDGAANPTSVSLIASRDIFPTTNEGTALTKEMTLSLKNVTLPANRILEAYMMFSAAGVTIADGDQFTVAVVTPAATYVRDLTLSAQTWAGGGQYTLQLKNFNVHNFDINNVADLEMFRDGVNSGDILWQTVHANLTTDIDCSSITSWTPIGNGTFTPVESGTVSATWEGPAFQGVFDGQGHAIKNLNMTGSPATYKPFGLFGILYKATVKDLTLGAASSDTGALTATPQGRMDAGAVAGVAYGATVQNVTNYFPMTIPTNSSSNRVAMAMVGYVYGDAASGPSVLSGLQNYGKVKAQSPSNSANGATSIQVAGIAGFGNSGSASVTNSINSSTNYADIEAKCGRSAGVLATANTRTALNGCVNRGNITNTFSNARIGGICVIFAGGTSMTDCSNYGDVIATADNTQLGGLACMINNANVTVQGGGNHGRVLGDISGYHGTLIANMNAFSSVKDLVAGGAYGTYNGGDYQYIVLTDSNYMGYIGKIASGSESKVTNITFEAWDGYPAANETLISNATQLQAFVAKVNNGEFATTDVAKLTADIDCSSITSWTPIGNVSMSAWTYVNLTTSGYDFMGTFDGQGHTISNLAMSFSSSGSYKAYGFFGSIGNGATVKNIVFDNSCSMSISASYGGAFGMLAGLVKGATIENIENHGAITGGGTSSLANGATGRCAVGAIIGEVHPSTSPASLTGLHNFGNIGTSESSIFTAYNNVQTGANAVHVGGIAGFSTNTNNATTVSFTNCINDGDIYTNAGRSSGIVAAANRYTSMKGCINNGDMVSTATSSRLGNITCIAGPGSILDGCINYGDLIAADNISVAGVVCLVNDASVQLKNTSSLGATIIGKNVNVGGNQTYNGVLFGYCNVDAIFSNCSINGKIGTSTTDLVTLTSENYFQYAGQATSKATKATTTNITFASE